MAYDTSAHYRAAELLFSKMYHFQTMMNTAMNYGHRFLGALLLLPPSAGIESCEISDGSLRDRGYRSAQQQLIDPANYRHPFEMNYTSCDDYEMQLLLCYQPLDMTRTVGIVFSSLAARAIAEVRLSERSTPKSGSSPPKRWHWMTGSRRPHAIVPIAFISIYAMT
ncbi:MAG: hypothetical protein MZV65_32515 [Chromatiales bacterium]|nr:hypothetical protein [Chromatiales bacterium]